MSANFEPNAEGKQPVIHVDGLKKSFGKLEVLKGITESIYEGEVVSIIGPSGGGKSTFLRCPNLLETPTGGAVYYRGTNIMDKSINIDQYRQRLGMVFQNYNVFPHLKVLDNITIAPMLEKETPRTEAEEKALQLLNRGVGCNHLREHIIDGARIHYAYIDAGGTAPNVVQDHATVRYEVRSPYVHQVKELFARVVRVAQGAALMTDTKMTCELCMAFTECIPNLTLAKIADEALTEVGAPDWNASDYELAHQFLESYNDFTKQTIRTELAQIYGADRIDAICEKPLDAQIHHFDPQKIVSSCGSTDVGDVAAAVPTVQFRIAGCCARNGGHYVCPLPDYVKPPLDSY